MTRPSSWVTRGVRLAAASLGVTGAIAGAQTAARPDSTGTIVGVVVMKDGGLPLAFSVASIPALGRERFSNAEGVFVLAEVPAGTAQIRVKHLGYSPADLAVTVHAGRADTVRVQLTHIAVRLTAMLVRAFPECRNPGIPHASTDSAFATVFEQLRQNAEQYRFLAATYPFVSAVERTLMNRLVNGDLKMDVVDTITLQSASEWKYKPGGVVTSDGARRLGSARTLIMNIPTLVHFADPTFLDNHCFYNGGVETVDGTDMLRIDFTAAARIAEPDVNGTMYLDPASFQIRRSVLRLSRIPRGITGLKETEAVTYFGELFPSIPVVAGISSVNRLEPRPLRPESISEMLEQQQLLRVHFLKGLPGEDVRKP